MAQEPLPDTKPEINHIASKKLGFFAHLISKLGGGSAATGGLGAGSAASGFGASSGLGGLFGAGGLLGAGGVLATKAGVVGVLVIGTTIAGSVGYIGYKFMGGTSGSGGFQDAQSLFHTRSASQGTDGAQGTGATGGSDASASNAGESSGLQFFVNANKSMKEAEGAGAADVKEAAADSASASASASVAGNNNNAPGASDSGPKLKGGKKIGGLSSALGGSSTGGTSASRSGAAPNTTLAKGLTPGGRTGAMTAGGKSRASGGRRGISGVRRGTAIRQLGGVQGDHRGARSSSMSGRTYDGGSTAGGHIGPAGGVPGAMAGPDAAAPGEAPPPNNPGTLNEEQPQQVPEVTNAGNVTPYQDEIEKAQIALIAAAALVMVAAMLMKKYFSSYIAALTATGGTPALAEAEAQPWKIAIIAVLGLAAVAALAAAALGVQVATAEYGQKTQGWIMVVGAVFVGAGIGLMLADVLGDPPTAAQLKSEEWKANAELYKEVPMLIKLTVGAGVVAGIGATMSKPKNFDCAEPRNEDVCREHKSDIEGASSNYRRPGMPSEHVLDQYLLAQESDHGYEQES